MSKNAEQDGYSRRGCTSYCKMILAAMFVIAVAALCFAIAGTDDSSAATSGSCGDGVTWSYNTETGALTISGEGAMDDFAWGVTRWDGNTIRSVTVTDGVTRVGKYAFYQCNDLESVTLADSVTAIADDAFYKCPSLATVTFGSSLNSINQWAFQDCTSLTTITIPDSVTIINNAAFWGCTALATVNMGNSVKTIGASAFRDCTSLTSFYIPDTVTNLYVDNALMGDTALTSITVAESNPSYSSADGVLFNKAKTVLMIYPAAKTSTTYTVPNTVKQIQGHAFQNNSYVTSITLPNDLADVIQDGNVKTYAIQSNAFENCTALESIVLPDGITAIREGLFRGCTSLTSVTFGSGVNYFDNSVFRGCTALETMTIPEGVSKIYGDVFTDCTSLTTLNIPASLTDIGHGSGYFPGCTSLTTVNVDGSNPNFSSSDGLLLNKAGNTLVYYPMGRTATSITIPGGITSIGERAFFKNTTIQTLTVPSGVASIKDYAFYQCTSLTTLSLPNSLRTLAGYAFYNCTGLVSVDIPSGVNTMENTSFGGCSSLTALNIDPSNATYSSDNGIVFSKDGKTLIWYPLGRADTTYAIPSGVTTVGGYSFSKRIALTSVTIPNTVVTIDEMAFDGCTGLTSLTIPANVTTINRYAFRGCTGLTSLTIPGTVKTVGSDAFYGCTGLVSLTLSEGIETFGTEVFGNCDGLTSVVIPESLTATGGSDFAYCDNLTSITIPGTITLLSRTVYNCSALETITIPEGVTNLSETFYGCHALKTVILPESVETMGNGTFGGCLALEYLTIGSNVTSISAFTNAPAFSIMLYDGEGNILNVQSYDSNDHLVNAERLRGHTFVKIGDRLTRGNYVSFETNGGNNIERIWVVDGGTVSAPNNPTKDYYTFDKWCSDVELNSEFSFSTPITAGTTLYADWEPVEFSIGYNLNGGTNNPGNPAKFTVESAFSFLDPAREGYTFRGWFANEGLTGEPVTGVTLGTHQNISLYAGWDIKTCTISFDSRGGSDVAPITKTFGSTVTAPADPTKTGNTFVEWQLNGVRYTFTTMPADSIELVAVWSVNNYVIEFDTDGGTEIANKTLAYGAAVSVTPPTKTGYSFAGWNPALPETMPANNLSIKATWTANNHTVTYNENGGIPMEPNTLGVTYGSSYELATPTHSDPENNRFAGWKYGDNIIPMSGIWNIDEDVELEAQWSAVQYYEVRFTGGDGAAGTMNALRKESEQGITMPACAFTKTGYDFTVWKISDGETTYEVDDHYTVTGDVTFVAQWTLKSYAIHYKLDNVEFDAGDYSGKTGTYSNLVTVMPVYQKTGYDVTEWATTDVAVNDNQFTMPAKEVTFTATSSPHRYTLTLMIEDGTPGSVFATYNAKTSSFTSASRTGYNILGYKVNDLEIMDSEGNLLPNKGEYTDASGNWIKASDVTLTAVITPIKNDLTISYKDTAGNDMYPAYDQMYDYGVPYSIHSPEITGHSPDITDVTGVMGLEAVIVTVTYTPNRYTISFDSNEGTLVSSITEYYGTAISAPADPTKTGYNFNGWKRDGNAYAMPSTMPAENVSLVASWTIKQVTITFNTVGGSVIAPITQEYNTEVTAPADPTKTGCTFIRWNPSVPAKMPANDLTVSAVWEANQYDITFDSNGGTAIDKLVAFYGTEISAPANPTKEGYDFAGWNPAFPATMPGENITLTASWSPKQYTIVFDTQGGSAIDSKTQDYASAIVKPADPTRTGHTFMHWSPAIPETMPLDGITVYAVWYANQYTITFDTAGGSAIDSKTQDYGSLIVAPADPTKEGYDFAGWTPAIPETMPLDGITVTAVWNIKQYTVTFDTAGGTEIAAISVDYDSAIPAPANPTREGYMFTGWNPAIPAKMPAGDLTLVATWYTVKTTETAIEISDKAETVVIDSGANEIESFLADTTKTEIDVKGDGWQMSIPKEIISSTTGPISVGAKIMAENERAALPQELQERISGKTVYSLSLSDTSGKVTFTGKSIKVSLPYTLKDGENASDVKVFYIDDNNELHEVEAKYDTATGCAVFETDHFSNWFVDVVPDDSGSSNIGLIIGIVVGVLVIGAIVAFFVLKKNGKTGGKAGSA